MIEVFSHTFMQHALIASLMIAAICSILGVYVVINRIVFVGAALAQVSSAGIALAFLLGLNPVITSLVLTLGGVALFGLRGGEKGAPRDSLLGVAFVAAGAASILLLSKTGRGNEEVVYLLQGNILAVTLRQIYFMAGLFFCVAVMHYLFHKEFLFLSVDPEMARTQGFRVKTWNLLLYLTLGVTIALAIRSAGVLLVFSFLVMPPLFGLMAAKRLRAIFALSMVAALLSSFFGLYLSFIVDLPSAPSIVALLGGVLLLTAGVRHALGTVKARL